MLGCAGPEFSNQLFEGELGEVHTERGRSGDVGCERAGVDGNLWQHPFAALLLCIVGSLARLGGAFGVADAVMFWVLPDKQHLGFVSKHVMSCLYDYVSVLGCSSSIKCHRKGLRAGHGS